LFIFIGTRAYASTTFNDVASHSRYATAFSYLSDTNIVHGYPDGTGRPNAPLSRVEALKTILRANEKFAPQIVWFQENLPALSLFSDTHQDQWYSSYIEVGFLEGVVTGFSNGTFHPSEPLTVEQAIVMLDRSYKKNDEVMTFQTSPLIKNNPGEWYSESISRAIDRHLLMAGQELRLGTPITRGQFFDILYRLHSIERTNRYVFEGPEPQTAYAPSVPTSPVVTVPFSITPIPFSDDDPYTLRLEPPRTTFNLEPPPEIRQHQYASQKEFAITIPSLNIYDVSVGHPDDPFTQAGMKAPLVNGLGHLFAYPGSVGKVMIYGHSSSYAWDVSEFTRIFRQINKMQVGDRIYITFEGRLYVYEVTHGQIIDAADVSPFNDDGTSELILYTCWPPDNIAQRHLKHAVPVETIALR
jgi:LPXTG-site transpeptidase (sortase) family protein